MLPTELGHDRQGSAQCRASMGLFLNQKKLPIHHRVLKRGEVRTFASHKSKTLPGGVDSLFRVTVTTNGFKAPAPSRAQLTHF
jgi:hypothetical protein